MVIIITRERAYSVRFRRGWNRLARILGVMNLKIVLEASDEGGYTASVPALPGCISEGDSRDDALRNIREAIELYLEPWTTASLADTAFKSRSWESDQGSVSQLPARHYNAAMTTTA